MRILVYPHSMELGGSQINAVELAAAVRDLGHEVLIYAESAGSLGELIDRLKLQRVTALSRQFRPSPRRALHLARLVRERRIDIVHGYEWPPALEAFAATALQPGSAAVATVMSMSVAPFLPASMPLVVGTKRICDAVQSKRRSSATTVIEPPVDTSWNRVGNNRFEFMSRYGIDSKDATVVIVSRLAHELKLEGILTAIRAVGTLSIEGVKLVIVGDGPAMPEVRNAADRAPTGRVLLTGELSDPRGAYEAATVVIGMGGSALRGLAFAKPLIVQGERGFFELLGPGNVREFLTNGWYGVGDGKSKAAELHLQRILYDLLKNHERRDELGLFGRSLVTERFSLTSAALKQERIYFDTLHHKESLPELVSDAWLSAKRLASYKVNRRWSRLKGTVDRDDYNARPF